MAVSSTPRRVTVRIDVHADFLCPWCYIEKRSMEEAMTRFHEKYPGAVEFEVRWRPYFLNPLIKSSCDKMEFYASCAGGSDSFTSYEERITAKASQYGLKLCLGKPGLAVGPSRNAHKLSALFLRRLGPSAQSSLIERLFQGNFVQGKDVSNEDWLRSVGAEVLGEFQGEEGATTVGSLSVEEIEAELASAEAGRMIDREVRGARERDGVKAVPCVTVQGKMRLGGYQDAGVFMGPFEKAYHLESSQGS